MAQRAGTEPGFQRSAARSPGAALLLGSSALPCSTLPALTSAIRAEIFFPALVQEAVALTISCLWH